MPYEISASSSITACKPAQMLKKRPSGLVTPAVLMCMAWDCALAVDALHPTAKLTFGVAAASAIAAASPTPESKALRTRLKPVGPNSRTLQLSGTLLEAQPINTPDVVDAETAEFLMLESPPVRALRRPGVNHHEHGGGTLC